MPTIRSKGAQMALNPLQVTRDAVKAVPVVRFALGLAAIAIFFSVVRGAIPDVSIVKMFPLMAAIMVLMLLLVLLAAAAEARERISYPALLLVWAITLCVIVILGAGVSALLIGKPERFAKLILPEVVANKPLFKPADETPKRASAAPLQPASPIKQEVAVAIPKADNLKTTVASSPENKSQHNPVTQAKLNADSTMTAERTKPVATPSSATTPATVAGPFVGITVAYYAKGLDTSRLEVPLKRNGVPYTLQQAQLTDPKLVTNAIACSPDVPIEALQRVITSFRQAGIPIVDIFQFRNTNKRKRIEILSHAYETEDGTLQLPTNRPLSSSQTRGLTGCPVELMNE